jgi:hypothetical protein
MASYILHVILPCSSISLAQSINYRILFRRRALCNFKFDRGSNIITRSVGFLSADINYPFLSLPGAVLGYIL